jgi:undecaprenyl-diphosphatase
MSHLTYPEAMVVGLIQGVTELFPVSSLGHNVLIPALIGGSWAHDLNVSADESPYLAFIVGLHVATAIAMIAYFWRDWLRILRGFFSSLAQRRVDTADQRLAWMIILATIPVGVAGLALEHLFRVVFSKPIPTALFLAANGVILLGSEKLRRHSGAAVAGGQDSPGDGEDRLLDRREEAGAAVPAHRLLDRREEVAAAVAADRRLARMSYVQGVLIGTAQIFALLPGISRDGIVMATGLLRGLSREDAARFSFLLSAPVILAAGALKVPDLMGPLGNGIRGQVLAGSILSGVGAYLSIRFLVRYFRESRPLTPFGIYCLLAGIGSAIYLTVR